MSEIFFKFLYIFKIPKIKLKNKENYLILKLKYLGEIAKELPIQIKKDLNSLKLTTLNIILITISIIFIFTQAIFYTFNGDMYLLAALIILLMILVVDISAIVQQLLKLKTQELKYLSEEDKELSIPKIPEAPKASKISINTSGLSTEIIEKIKLMEGPEIKVVLVNCERCKGVIPVPVPEKIVKKSELPVVPISFVHEKNDDRHCITIYLDHDFDIRRQRLSDVILS